MATWTVRAELPVDVAQIHALTAAAFPTDEEAQLVDALRGSGAWIDGLSIVAEESAGTLLGHALLTRCHVDEVPALCLAPCSVLPASQRMGVGGSVIRAALDAARVQGEAFVVVLGHPAYYPRFGFRRASEANISLGIDVPDEALMAMTLDGSRSLPAGVVRYAEAFGIGG